MTSNFISMELDCCAGKVFSSLCRRFLPRDAGSGFDLNTDESQVLEIEYLRDVGGNGL